MIVELYRSGFVIVGIGPSPTFDTYVQVPSPTAGLVAAIVVLVAQVTFWFAPATAADGAAKLVIRT